MGLQNTWYHRRVADANAKACWICFKPTSSVLTQPDNKDFFYICLGHLKDRNFATPDADEVAAAAERNKKEELEKEIEKVKKEYEEKQKKKKEKREAKEKEKDGKKDKEEKKKEEEEDRKDEKEKDEKIKELSTEDTGADNGPRIYTLHKNFYQMRLDRIRNAEVAKRNRERLKNPSLFPSVPSGDL